MGRARPEERSGIDKGSPRLAEDAQIKPTTRIDVGFALGDTKTSGRLTDTGGRAKGDRITHRIAIASVDEVDNEVKRWLKKAYERDA